MSSTQQEYLDIFDESLSYYFGDWSTNSQDYNALQQSLIDRLNFSDNSGELSMAIIYKQFNAIEVNKIVFPHPNDDIISLQQHIPDPFDHAKGYPVVFENPPAVDQNGSVNIHDVATIQLVDGETRLIPIFVDKALTDHMTEEHSHVAESMNAARNTGLELNGPIVSSYNSLLNNTLVGGAEFHSRGGTHCHEPITGKMIDCDSRIMNPNESQVYDFKPFRINLEHNTNYPELSSRILNEMLFVIPPHLALESNIVQKVDVIGVTFVKLQVIDGEEVNFAQQPIFFAFNPR